MMTMAELSWSNEEHNMKVESVRRGGDLQTQKLSLVSRPYFGNMMLTVPLYTVQSDCLVF